jgi:Uncharacterised protein family (UPF0236)
MSRRRQSRKPPKTTAPNDGTPLGHLSDAELMKEFARRLVARGEIELGSLELMAEKAGQEVGAETLASTVASLPPEDSSPKPCPKCGRPVRVKARNRVRHVLTVAGELRISRNYHHCAACELGFYPRDRELNLPEKGDVSSAMEKRILDFGVNDTFESAAERWDIHYPFPISANLVRRVVDRVGERAESAWSELSLQQACLPSPEELPRTLVVAADGSMLLTREEAWREAKVAVVARGESFVDEKNRRTLSEARYVAVLGNQEEFGKALGAALEAERADEVPSVVWLGDGARENWTLATKYCPLAIQVLDIPHAVQNGVTCGKALLGEGDAGLPLWEERIRQLIDGPSPDAAIRELLDCIPFTQTEDQLAALDQLVGYYRANEQRMRYSLFREWGLPVGSGIVESAHRHVLQVRMKRAGQRWAVQRARRMARLRAAYRTAGARRFHWAIGDALKAPPLRAHQPLPNGPRRAKPRRSLHRGSRLNRAALAASN